MRDEKVVFEYELSPYFVWVLRIYDEALKSGKPPGFDESRIVERSARPRQ